MQASTLGPASVRDLTLAPRPLSVVVLGAGKIGRVIATMLADSGDYRVCLVDHDAHRLDGVPRGITVRAGDPAEPGTCAALLAGADAVMNALPFHAAHHDVVDLVELRAQVIGGDALGVGAHAALRSRRRVVMRQVR